MIEKNVTKFCLPFAPCSTLHALRYALFALRSLPHAPIMLLNWTLAAFYYILLVSFGQVETKAGNL